MSWKRCCSMKWSRSDRGKVRRNCSGTGARAEVDGQGQSQVTNLKPVPAEAEQAPETIPEEIKEELQLLQPRRTPFIPPKPVVAEQSTEEGEPEPFAAAAMENARSDPQKPQQERRRRVCSSG